MWLCESSATFTFNVALPKLVNVAEPVASPDNVNIGSLVAVVVIVISDEPSNNAVPVTAPFTLIVFAIAKLVAVSALPVISLEIVAGKCASDIVPLFIFDAFKLVNAAPLPLKLVAVSDPVIVTAPVILISGAVTFIEVPAIKSSNVVSD